MDVALFQYVSTLLLEKHYGLELDDTALTYPSIVRECIEAGLRPYQVVAEHAREADLDRIDKSGMYCVSTKDGIAASDEASAMARVMASLMQWQPIDTAPREGYCLGYDPGLKRPFVMIWNVADAAYAAADGLGDEAPTHWMPLPPGPTGVRHAP